MPINLEKLIRYSEEKWQKVLISQCRQQFSKVYLPSHDEVHHQRVWVNAKLLLHHLLKQGIPISEIDIERLMIAVFFHDQGMSESLLKEHGKISRHICKEFFKSTGTTLPAGFDKVLQAIENHDQKDYSSKHQSRDDFDIQRLLNIADDLDALGVIGAYRYLEIYLLRNIRIELLPEAVLTNLGSRFQHFSEAFAEDPSFVKAQLGRYASTKNYFKDLNMQLKLVEYNPEFYLGPIGVANYIKKEIIGKKRNLLTVCKEIMASSNDFYVKHFFERLVKEAS